MNTTLRCLKRSSRYVSQGIALRSFSNTRICCNIPVPEPDNEFKTASPKIEELVTSISQLTLIEVAELSQHLKKRLNLPDAPIMPIGGFAAAATSAPEEEEVQKVVQTNFTVKLTKFDEKQKVAIIKEIKNLVEGLNLVQAKKFVESAPVVVRADIPKDEAEKIVETLSKVGAVAEII